MSDLALIAVISGPLGAIDLESGPYALERGAMEEVAVAWRKREVENPWVEGSYVTGAVRSNVARPLNVWVAGANRAAYVAARDALTDALEQLTWTLTFGVDGVTATWRCSMADYVVREQQEFLHAHTGLVRATVPTLPTAIA